MTDKAAVAALVKAMATVSRQGVYSCSVAHYDANGFPAQCPDGPKNEAEAILTALPAGWTLTNAAPDAHQRLDRIRALEDQAEQDSITLLALREALKDCEERIYWADADGLAAGLLNRVRVALQDTAPAADAIKSEIEKPWRVALDNLAKRHEWQPGAGSCVCFAHLEARALLTEDAKP